MFSYYEMKPRIFDGGFSVLWDVARRETQIAVPDTSACSDVTPHLTQFNVMGIVL